MRKLVERVWTWGIPSIYRCPGRFQFQWFKDGRWVQKKYKNEDKYGDDHDDNDITPCYDWYNRGRVWLVRTQIYMTRWTRPQALLPVCRGVQAAVVFRVQRCTVCKNVQQFVPWKLLQIAPYAIVQYAKNYNVQRWICSDLQYKLYRNVVQCSVFIVFWCVKVCERLQLGECHGLPRSRPLTRWLPDSHSLTRAIIIIAIILNIPMMIIRRRRCVIKEENLIYFGPHLTQIYPHFNLCHIYCQSHHYVKAYSAAWSC